MGNSGTIILVFSMGDDVLDSAVVAVFGDRTSPGPGKLSDHDWFCDHIGQAGLDEMLDPDAPVAPGYWIVRGHLWSEYSYGPNGDDFDSGFEIETFDPLPLNAGPLAIALTGALGLENGDCSFLQGLAWLVAHAENGQAPELVNRLRNIQGALEVIACKAEEQP